MRIPKRVSSLSSLQLAARSVIPEEQEGSVYGSVKRSLHRKNEGRVVFGGSVDGVPVAVQVAVNLGGGRVMNLGLTADRYVVGDRHIKRVSADVAARHRGALARLLSEAARVPGLLVAGYRYPPGGR